MKFVKNTVTNKFELVPADSANLDTTGEIQPKPKDNLAPEIKIDSGFDESFYP